MPLSMDWISEADYDRLAMVRAQCYAPQLNNITRYREGIPGDKRGKAGDFVIARRDGVDVGTSTSLSLKMWIRGACVPCQGVAYVGTVKTHRRGGSKGERLRRYPIDSPTRPKHRKVHFDHNLEPGRFQVGESEVALKARAT